MSKKKRKSRRKPRFKYGPENGTGCEFDGNVFRYLSDAVVVAREHGGGTIWLYPGHKENT